MKEEFIPYEQALSLKELGFDEPCIKEFHVQELMANSTGEEITNNELTELYGEQTTISAPLYQQAFRWFREKYNIQLGICHIHGGFDCWTNDGDLFENGKYCNFKTYEEAELECLKKLIEIVKQLK
jgi:hypothetical protein